MPKRTFKKGSFAALAHIFESHLWQRCMINCLWCMTFMYVFHLWQSFNLLPELIQFAHSNTSMQMSHTNNTHEECQQISVKNEKIWGKMFQEKSNKKETIEVMCISCNILRCCHCCHGKPVFWVCVCSLRYAVGKSHYFCTTLYCHLWTVWLYHIFPHYLINSKIF
jgi:hypothetical protein